jgi:hypothetical protein
MSRATSNDRGRRAGCPLCGKPSAEPHRPFCSQGCRDRDLLNWLGDSYRVPGPPAEGMLPENDEDRLDTDR